ncbi:MAG: hypothetical protein JWP87_5370 [Labilithrix sp.]|nr:hypothetical protein [Labilithrix sp.]
MSDVTCASGMVGAGEIAYAGETSIVRAAPACSADILPPPLTPATSDDLMTALTMLSMQQLHEERNAADQQRSAASKAQEEAQADKITKMRELAEDTFNQGLVEGVLGGLGAIASAASAVSGFAASTTSCGLEEASLARNGKLLQVTSDGLNAASKFGGASARTDQENDRTDMAVADAAIDRAKAATEAASTTSRRAADDLRETMNNLRQYLAAKIQLGNAMIIKG